MAYPLVLLSRSSSSVLDSAQQQLEWMSEHIGSAFGAKRDNPFEMKCLQALTCIDQLARLPAGPKVWTMCPPAWTPICQPETCSAVRRWCWRTARVWSTANPSSCCSSGRRTAATRSASLTQPRCEILSQRLPPAFSVCCPHLSRCLPGCAQRHSVAEQMQSHVTGAEPLVVRMQRAQRMPLAGPELEQHMRLLGQAVEVAEEGLPEEAASSPQGGTSLAMATSSQAREAGEAGAPAPMAAAVPDGFMPCPVGLVGFMLKGLRQCAAISLPLTLLPFAGRHAPSVPGRR